MRETKAAMLARKNAELRTIQARLRGLRRFLEPLSKSSNCTIEIRKILLLLDFTNDQAGRFAAADSGRRKEMLGLKKISYKEAESYCARHFEKNVEQKLEEVKQIWLDKLEEQVLDERDLAEGESS